MSADITIRPIGAGQSVHLLGERDIFNLPLALNAMLRFKRYHATVILNDHRTKSFSSPSYLNNINGVNIKFHFLSPFI
jgi:hypothetical protein